MKFLEFFFFLGKFDPSSMNYAAVAVVLNLSMLMLYGRVVHCQRLDVVKVGAVFTFDSVIGRAAKTAMEMAVYDVNADPTILNGTELKILMEDASCSVFMGSIKAIQLIEKEVVTLIGPQSSSIARMISDIANGLKVPVVSYASTDPTLSSLQFPYFFRTTHTDSNQMSAIAEIIEFYGWKEIIAIFVDNDHGRNGVTSLGDALVKKKARISYKLPLPTRHDQNVITEILNKSKSLGPRVYVVHMDPDPRLNFFIIVKKLDMMNDNYVWFATDWLSSTLDSNLRHSTPLDILAGVITLRPYIPETSKKRVFMSRWRNMQSKNLAYSNFNTYGFYAYDTVWLVANSIDRLLKENKSVTFSQRDKFRQEKLKESDAGELLLKIISHEDFTGLTGQVRFDASHNLITTGYEILNIVSKAAHKVGYWSNDIGLSVLAPEYFVKNNVTSSFQDRKLENIIWPGGKVEKPRGWAIGTAEKPLRIGFPKRTIFTEFVTELNHSHKTQGYCVDLFNEMRKLVPYEVPFRFVPFGNGLNNPNYDELVNMVADNVFDAAVGDIAIVTERMKIVDFTQPFVATGLVILAPIKSSKSSGWVFLRPFSLEMWCVTAAFFVVIAVVIWMLEHRVNDAFRGPPRRQLKTMFLFSFSTLFKVNREKTVSTLGRIVMVVWLFLILVLTSSYTASLTSILTAEQLSTSITGIGSLVSSGLPIGYQVGSFAYSYMSNILNIPKSRLICLHSPEEYETALRRGPKNGGVAAIVDEIPYVELFLSEHTDFGIVGQSFMKSGWGFAFQKDSPLAVDMSTAILKLAESGKLQKIHKKWFCKSGCSEEQTRQPEANQIHLNSFLALYSLCAMFTFTAFLLFFIRSVRQYIEYRRKQTNPCAPSSSVSSSVLCSQAIHNFLYFIDEKEEAIKKIFRQHDQKPHSSNPINGTSV